MNLKKFSQQTKRNFHTAAHWLLNGGAVVYAFAHWLSASGVPLPSQYAGIVAGVVALGNILLKKAQPADAPPADAKAK